ncbi:MULTISPECIES: class I SAM-dependent DNA methyltransferase [Thiorhodovibrio]|uniref:class I SAM-dependent DNA methyltransferase n=1 Tax=Thiorhodovibrio TaxID=61593 RepID=UPI0019122E4E|nr:MULTISPECIES: class I SAM-dependent DNA methyltransferase [Thiorhodovibrio]MBK5970387.1 DNA methyltransferase [Thiorhodovibrio winogradskyi]WPL14310.1 putative type I restriction enzymeP M protein [Thiorhodovibrio litoralis]
MNTASIISKVWSFCHTLRDDGVGYGDYLEQLTYLIFLKMAAEYAKPPYSREMGIPARYDWESLKRRRGAELEAHYIDLLRELGTRSGMLGKIFTKAQNKIQDPAKLYRLINMVDEEQWVMMGADVKGDIYEGLLEKNAEDTKSGAGQYFTPRALIRVMVECVRPEPGKTIADPACGTGGFFLAAYDFLNNPDNHQLDKAQKAFLKHQTFHGHEIVANTRRLCLMNMFLHNIGEIDSEGMISPQDALIAPSPTTYDYVLANPPFGKKSSMSFTNDEGEEDTEELTYNRQDFWATTSNKQLNFVQHIRTMLKTTGRAAVVVPDNVLFEGGAGETIRAKLLETTDLHTILRLPTGVFYAQGVKANVLFFDNRPASPDPQTREVWYYDYRTNVHHTLKKKPMRFEDLADFIACYQPRNRHERRPTWNPDTNAEGRWRTYSRAELIARDKTSLDVFWLKDKSLTDLDNLPEPEDLAAEIIENLEAGLRSFRSVLAGLTSENNDHPL